MDSRYAIFKFIETTHLLGKHTINAIFSAHSIEII
jgi:hypothetical protein